MNTARNILDASALRAPDETGPSYIDFDSPVVEIESRTNSENEEVTAIGPDETRIHRMVAALLIEGKTPGVIAATLNIGEAKVRTLLRQEHTQLAVNELAQTAGTDVVAQVLKASELDTVFRLIEIRDRGLTDGAKLTAAGMLLKMRNGNVPIRPKNEEDEQSGDLAEQIARLDQTIARIKESK